LRTIKNKCFYVYKSNFLRLLLRKAASRRSILSHNIIDRLEIIEPPAIYFELFKGGINNIVPNNCTIILSIEMPPKNSAILYLLSEVFAAIFFIRIEMTFYH